jgi:hypothetical protein
LLALSKAATSFIDVKVGIIDIVPFNKAGDGTIFNEVGTGKFTSEIVAVEI